MRPIYTFAEAVEAIENVSFEQCRKAALVLRACNFPVTEEGYMFEEHITFLALNAAKAAEAYDKAEEKLAMEETELSNKRDDYNLPEDSDITSRTIAARAAETYQLVTP
jgi:hypothetical protein